MYPKIDLALLGRLVRRRWHALTALALLGALLGFGLSFVLSPGYVSSSKVLLQGERDKDQLPGESEVATSSVVLDRVAETLGWSGAGRDLRERVSAVVDLNVIEISGSAESPERARQLTEQVTTQYVIFSAQISRSGVDPAPARSTEQLQRSIDEATDKIKNLRSSPSANAPNGEGERVRDQIVRAQADIRRASADLSRAGGQDGSGAPLSRSSGSVIEPATLPTGPASPSMLELIAGGALVLTAAGVFGHLLRLRLDARLWEQEEVAAALGTPVLGCVDVPGLPNRAGTGRGGLLRDDLGWSRPDALPVEDVRTRHAGCGRALRNLRGDRAAPFEVLVLTVNGDPTAMSAVTELVLAAAATGPVRLVGDDRDLVESMLEQARDRGLGGMVSAGPPLPDGRGRTRFEIVAVSPVHPRVPEGVGASRAVAVVTPGTLTGLELAALAAACAEADRPLSGVVLAVPRVTDRRRASAAPADGAADPATAGAGTAS